MLSRWGRPTLAAFPAVAAALGRLPDAVLDAELVVPTPEGRSDFEELRRRNLLQRTNMIAEAAVKRPAAFVVFDLLALEDADWRGRPLLDRRREHRYIPKTRGVQVIEHIATHGAALFNAIVADDHEGIVAKRTDAPYRAGPSSAWLKIKNKRYSRRGAVEWRRGPR